MYKSRNVKIFLRDIYRNVSRCCELKAATKTDDKNDTLYRWNKIVGRTTRTRSRPAATFEIEKSFRSAVFTWLTLWRNVVKQECRYVVRAVKYTWHFLGARFVPHFLSFDVFFEINLARSFIRFSKSYLCALSPHCYLYYPRYRIFQILPESPSVIQSTDPAYFYNSHCVYHVDKQ